MYAHLVNHESMGAPEVPNSFIAQLRSAFTGNAPDVATFYTPGEVGYLDYPTLALVEASSAS